MEKSRWQQYKEKNGVTPLDALNPATKKVSEEIAQKRLDICKQCPHLLQLTIQCKKCGCFIGFFVLNASTKFISYAF